ncbi:MAG: hypothetical protein KKD44_28695 [Proteobacteria bacterium]|nr:hypothetical protein [Pseudomonadota bacterium]
MELRDKDGLYIISPNEKKALDELNKISLVIQHKWFSIGREMVKLIKELQNLNGNTPSDNQQSR